MSDSSQDNDWDVDFRTICFVTEQLDGHNAIKRFSRTKDILFKIERVKGDTLNMLLVHKYCLSEAAVRQAKAEFPEADYIVTAGAMHEYTLDAKKYGNANNLGVFILKEFMGALTWQDPKKYRPKKK